MIRLKITILVFLIECRDVIITVTSQFAGLVAQLDAPPTGDQEVVGLTPTRLATFMKH